MASSSQQQQKKQGAAAVDDEQLLQMTESAVEALSLDQITHLETCSSAIAGDFQDLFDTTTLPSAKV